MFDSSIIASFDIGTKNFAFCIERTSTLNIPSSLSNDMDICCNGVVKHIEVLETKRTFVDFFKVLEERKKLWLNCDIFLIEKQLPTNHVAKMMEHYLESYFITSFGFLKKVIIWSSKFKTTIFTDSKLTKYQRKRFCIIQALKILTLRDDVNTINILNSSVKKDDMCDAFCQLQSFKIKRLEK